MEILFAVVFAIWIASLAKKIDGIKSELEALKKSGGVSTASSAVPQDQMVPTGLESGVPASNVVATPAYVGANVAPPDGWSTHAVAWLKKDFMVKLGAFLLLCALGWFVSYAFANNWIGPMGRITLGLLVGIAFMVLGIWRIGIHGHQGGIFTVLGSTTILLTMYAARELYDFFTPGSALFIMALSVAFVAFTSVRYNRNALALAGLVLASVAPLFTNTPAPDVTGLFVYLAVVVFGSLWVVYLRGWSNLTFAALVVVFLYGLPYLIAGIGSGDRDVALLFSFLFTAIFFVANILGLIANENDQNRQAHIAIALGTGFYLILWVTGAADEEWRSLLFTVWMLVFSLGSFLVYRVIESRVPFYIYGGTSIILLAAATAAELSGPVLTIAFTLEVGLLVGLTSRLLPGSKAVRALSWLFAGPIILSAQSIGAYSWSSGVFHDDFFALLILALSLSVVGRYLYERTERKEGLGAGVTLMVFGGVYGLIIIWLVLHALYLYDTATMAALVIYTIFGIGLVVWARLKESRAVFYAGSTLLGLVIARLLFVEVWQMSLSGRIITFLVIGLLLISTAFMRRSSSSQLSESNNQTSI